VSNYYFTNSTQLKGEYVVDKEVSAPTVVYLNTELNYQYGFSVGLSVNGVSVDEAFKITFPNSKIVEILLVDEALHGEMIEVTVNANSN
jgi:hypothetical protein